MSDFYTTLADSYGEIFPLVPAKINFLKNYITSKSHVLDLACGIGIDCQALATDCESIIGIDLEKMMIDQTPQIANGDFYQIDMVESLKQIETRSDLIYCVGNSLVHLPSLEDVQKLFDLIHQRLADTGQFIFQIINYDRILDDKIQSLPTIDFSRGYFKRDYEIQSEHVIFKGSLVVDKKMSESSVTLLAPRKEKLLLMLSKFRSLDFYGNFKGDEYTKDSFHLIIVASK